MDGRADSAGVAAVAADAPEPQAMHAGGVNRSPALAEGSGDLRVRSSSRWLWAAAVAGLLHGAASLYWMLGGTMMLETVGASVLEAFDGRMWMLAPVVLVKVAGAVVPLLMNAWPLLLRRLTRLVCWLGVAMLVGWGGFGMVVANLVLFGLITPEGGIDRPAMIGHAWLWDPLFVISGVCLAVGLWRTRARTGG